MNAEKFGPNVRLCREFLGITANELAKRSGVTPASISQIENGKRIPMLTIAVKIAIGLGANFERLLK